MATEQDDSDIPESGGVFTFGKSKFAENLPNKFWIRNDLVIQSACGDQHTVLFAESGRVFVFGDNAYGQLGLGNTKSQTKPSCVKALKGEEVSVIGCGAHHTLVGTSSGLLFTFGHNAENQCGHGEISIVETPKEVPLLKPLKFKQLCGGTGHSVGLERSGVVYVWGDNTDGQLGLGDDMDNIEEPTKLPLDEKVVHVACGYHHTAVVTASGTLYTFGEAEDGKLGHEQSDNAIPVRVDIPERVVWASCGGKHTVAVTAKGDVYTFGEGSSGQLGLGTSVMESSRPKLITSFQNIKIKYTSCGENFTAAISEKGQLYTFGDGRHGKLALGAENFSNQFRPFRVPRFAKFEVTEVSCGGCHTIALAHKRDEEDEDEEILDPLNSTFANSVRLSTDVDLNSSISARDRRRAKESPEPLSRTLPPLTSSTRGLPPLNSTYTTGKLRPVQSSTLPNSLDKRKLPNARFSKDDDEEDSNLSESPEEDSADEMRHKKQTQQSLKSKKQTTKMSAKGNLDSDVSVTPEDSSEGGEENSPTQQSFKNERQAMKKQSEKLAVSKGKHTPTKRSSKGNLSPISDEEYTFNRRSSRDERNVAAKNKKNRKALDSDEEVDSALEESDEEPIPKSKKGAKNDKKGRKKSKLVSEDEEVESEEETKKSSRAKKSKLSIFGNKKKAPIDFSDDENDDDFEEEEKPKPSKSKGKGSKKKQKKVVDSDDDNDDDNDDDIEDDGEKVKTKDKNKQSSNSNKAAVEEKPPEEKKSRACTIL